MPDISGAPATSLELKQLNALREAVAARKRAVDADEALHALLAPGGQADALSPLQEERIGRAVDNLVAGLPADQVAQGVCLQSLRELVGWIG